MNSSGNAGRGGVFPDGRILVAFLLLWSLALRTETPGPLATNLWQFNFDFSLHDNATCSTPAVAPDGTIYAGAFDGKLHALTPSGLEQWRFQAGRETKSSPAIADDGTIYFGAHNKKFYALDAGGNVRWTFLTEAEFTSSPAIGTDGSVYFSPTDGNLYHLRRVGGANEM